MGNIHKEMSRKEFITLVKKMVKEEGIDTSFARLAAYRSKLRKEEEEREKQQQQKEKKKRKEERKKRRGAKQSKRQKKRKKKKH